jgi:integrase
MPLLKQAVPKYRKHKASGQAVVTLGGKDHYLGPHGSKTSIAEYDRLIGEWLAGGRRLIEDGPETGLFIAELIAAYRRYARTYYVRSDGSRTDEVRMIDEAAAHVRRLYGRQQAAEFGPKKLKAVRQSMIDAGWVRTHINKQISRVKRMFRWATEEELIVAGVYDALRAVRDLRKNRSMARESNPVTPVDHATVDATLRALPPVVHDMVQIQRLTGCRPAEVCILRPCDVDRSGEVWVYTPVSHKMEYRDRPRIVPIGPKAQAVLRPYLLRPETWYCFSPKESECKRRELAHQARRTPLSQGNKPGSNVKATPKRKARERYTTASYRRAIHRAVAQVNGERQKADPQAETIEVWSPNRLRHLAATEIRRRFGIEAAQVILGHSRADVTQVYAERDATKAMEVAREVG